MPQFFPYVYLVLLLRWEGLLMLIESVIPKLCPSLLDKASFHFLVKAQSDQSSKSPAELEPHWLSPAWLNNANSL